MGKHKPMYVSQKFFVGWKDDLVHIYEFDSFFMTFLGSFPESRESKKWAGQLNDDFLLVGNQNSFMIIQTKNGFKLEEALKIQAQSVIFDPLKRKVFYIEENKLNCMFLQENQLVTYSVEIPFKSVENATLELKGHFVSVVVLEIAILIFKRAKLQFLKAIPMMNSRYRIISSSLINFKDTLTFNILKEEFEDIELTHRDTFYPIREVLSKFNLPSLDAIDKDGEYYDDKKRFICWTIK